MMTARSRPLIVRGARIAVIGLSVNAEAENQEAMRKAGAVQCLTKEAAVDDLYQAIQTAVYGNPSHSSSL